MKHSNSARHISLFLIIILALAAGLDLAAAPQQPDPILPPGVKAVWDMDKAFHETTPTRERICLNGLWQWQPGEAQANTVPSGNWGYFKVPGFWPGTNNYMLRDSQRIYSNPAWPSQNLGRLNVAWYQRDFSVPETWGGRRVTLRLEYLNSFASVFVDGKPAGEIQFPGGQLDITSACPPGPHSLALLVVAMPLNGVMQSYIDSAVAREVRGSCERRGLCGDMYLIGSPNAPRITDIRIAPSVRKKECTFDAALEGLAPDRPYRLQAGVSQEGKNSKTFTSHPFQAHDLKEGRIEFTSKWMPDKLWDTITPQNTCTLKLSLQDASGKELDVRWPERFGFREFWIDGRDFYLNGARIYLSAVPLDNGQLGAELASYGPARETMARLKSFGINCVYTHNYGCDPGSHISFAEILRAADDEGMLLSFSQPHFSHYNWQGTNADLTNGYARHAEYYVRAAQNHPAVVMYSMNHNAGGYAEDMNPDMIDGIHDVRTPDDKRGITNALRAEAIVRHLDPSRVVYHHASGNLGSMHTINFYPNFVPIQELDDWFGHWATEGVKPVFTCEYGAPFGWDWAMYRGWYKDHREWGNAWAPWEFCLSEWNSQFLGDRAFPSSPEEEDNLRWEATQYAAGKTWQRFNYPHNLNYRFNERFPIFALYLDDNFRAFRTWGVSAISPWEYGHFWKVRDGLKARAQDLKVDWDNLQRPGFSPDYIGVSAYERMDLDFERSDWVPTAAAQSLYKYNLPLLAWIAGKPSAFTSKDHNFHAGDTIGKQLIVINNSRRPVTCDCQWTLNLPRPLTGRQSITLPTGRQKRLAMNFHVPAAVPPGEYKIDASVRFNEGETQQDSFSIHIMPPAAAPQVGGKIALFDPKGETMALLNKLGVAAQLVTADADLSGYDILIVGKAALNTGAPAPDISRVRDGLKVLMFEQTFETLEKRFGFRVEEYGLRNAFARDPGHPCLAGIDAGNLCDWQGEATLTAPKLTYESLPRFGQAVYWCGIPERRAWRCGNRGNVASVIIEKPACGDFMPILDGGFSMQFTPLMEYREGKGLVMFCQMDVTGRTAGDPAAEALTRNLLSYVATWMPSPRRQAVYAGPDAGKSELKSLGIKAGTYNGEPLSPDQVLVLGEGAGATLAGHRAAIADWLKAGGNMVMVGVNQSDASALLPFSVTIQQREHITCGFQPGKPLLAGICPADVQNHAPCELPLVSAGADTFGDGVLALAHDSNVVFDQIPPWQFYSTNQANLRRTFRRTSFVLSRLLANMGVGGATPLLDRFHQPVRTEKRWLTGFYLDQPQEWDDPYRFFRW